MKKQEFYNHKKPRKLLDQVRDVMRLKHYAFRTEQTYIGWIKWSMRQYFRKYFLKINENPPLTRINRK